MTGKVAYEMFVAQTQQPYQLVMAWDELPPMVRDAWEAVLKEQESESTRLRNELDTANCRITELESAGAYLVDPRSEKKDEEIRELRTLLSAETTNCRALKVLLTKESSKLKAVNVTLGRFIYNAVKDAVSVHAHYKDSNPELVAGIKSGLDDLRDLL